MKYKITNKDLLNLKPSEAERIVKGCTGKFSDTRACPVHEPKTDLPEETRLEDPMSFDGVTQTLVGSLNQIIRYLKANAGHCAREKDITKFILETDDTVCPWCHGWVPQRYSCGYCKGSGVSSKDEVQEKDETASDLDSYISEVKESFKEKYESFELCEVVSKPDYDKLWDFIEQAIRKAGKR